MCYSLLVDKNNLKKALPLIVLILFLIPIITSSLLDLRQKQREEKAYLKMLAEQKAQKEGEERIYLLGKFEPSERGDFLPIPAEYNMSGYTTYLRKETLEAFIRMAEAAKKENVDLEIVSAVRNFDSQKKIWDDKWTGVTLVDGKRLNESTPDGLERFKKILEYSSVPGTSRHHWGTDIDINMTVPFYFQTEAGQKVYEWLVKNASTYGFCQPYSAKGQERPTGYNEEKWHWSYLPLAKDFTQRYKTLVTDKDITDFAGDENTASMNLINDYVLGISPECL
ncbi:MAG: M15 family metallopeptidase [Candidatus Paceibacterota bacterium]|jgi:LAS superfamily LD-carboxypeptidase LdcB